MRWREAEEPLKCKPASFAAVDEVDNYAKKYLFSTSRLNLHHLSVIAWNYMPRSEAAVRQDPPNFGLEINSPVYFFIPDEATKMRDISCNVVYFPPASVCNASQHDTYSVAHQVMCYILSRFFMIFHQLVGGTIATYCPRRSSELMRKK